MSRVPIISYETKKVQSEGADFSGHGTTNVRVMYHYENVTLGEDVKVFICDHDPADGISGDDFSREAGKLGYVIGKEMTLPSGTCIDYLCITVELIDVVEEGHIIHDDVHVDGGIKVGEMGSVLFNVV